MNVFTEDFANLVILILFVCLGIIIGTVIIASTTEQIISNGTISSIEINPEYYSYDVTTNDITVKKIISTSYYELQSEHKIMYNKDGFGITSRGRFI